MKYFLYGGDGDIKLSKSQEQKHLFVHKYRLEKITDNRNKNQVNSPPPPPPPLLLIIDNCIKLNNHLNLDHNAFEVKLT